MIITINEDDEEVRPMLLNRVQCMRDFASFLLDQIGDRSLGYDACCGSSSSSSSSSSSLSLSSSSSSSSSSLGSSSSSSSSGLSPDCYDCADATLSRSDALAGILSLPGIIASHVHPVSGGSGNMESVAGFSRLDEYIIGGADALEVQALSDPYEASLLQFPTDEICVGLCVKRNSNFEGNLFMIKSDDLGSFPKYKLIADGTSIHMGLSDAGLGWDGSIPSGSTVSVFGIGTSEYVAIVFKRKLSEVSAVSNCVVDSKTESDAGYINTSTTISRILGNTGIDPYLVRAFALSSNPDDYSDMFFYMRCIACSAEIL